MLAALFLVCSLATGVSRVETELSRWLLLLLYHLTFFFSTCGPGSTTYILPSLLYPQKELSLYHGLCTCMGKLGGALGASVFPLLIRKIGSSAVRINLEANS